MTSVKVVDASALAALLFGEPEADIVADGLSDARLVAPSLIGFELANVCFKKCRRHAAQAEALLTAFRLYEKLGVEEVSVDQSAVVELALQTDLTAYDASYLWLARRLEAELITLDKALKHAALLG